MRYMQVNHPDMACKKNDGKPFENCIEAQMSHWLQKTTEDKRLDISREMEIQKA